MMGLLLKDFYTLRQYGKALLFMLVFFAIISFGMDNPAMFFEGFFVMMSMMMTITSFSYDALAKWDRYALSLPLTKKDIVTGKYLLAIILCLSGTVISFLLTFLILKINPVSGFGVSEHLLATAVIFAIALFFASVLIPLVFKFGVEKGRFFLIAIFAMPTAALLVIDQLGLTKPSDVVLLNFAKLTPLLAILLFLLSYLLSVKIFSSKEI